MTDRPSAGAPSAGAPSAGAPSARDPGVATVLTDDRSPAVTVRLAVPGAAQMRLLGARLAGLLGPGDLVVLAGALGAGKTTLVQGIGDGLGVRGPVTSPTFMIARIHPALRGGPDLVHADAYRLARPAESDDLDLDAVLDHSVTVVEWGGGLAEGLAADRLEVTIDRPGAVFAGGIPAAAPAADGCAGPGDEPRTVRLAGWGERWAAAAESV